MYDLWVWEQPSWRVIATYKTSKEAHAAGKHSADPPDTWTVAKQGSQKDEHIRAHCTERDAPYS